MPVEVDCHNCGQTVERYPSDIEGVENVYCSKECHDEHQRKTAETAELDPGELHRLYHDEGLSTREVAEVLDSTHTTVRVEMERHGIDRLGRIEALGPGVGHYTDKKGYEIVYVGDAEFRVHSLLAIAEGHDPEDVFGIYGKVVHHKNGIPWDNRPENLEIITQSDHMKKHWAEWKEQGASG